MTSLARARRDDYTVYAHTTGQFCVKAASRVHSDEPAVARHDFGEVAK